MKYAVGVSGQCLLPVFHERRLNMKQWLSSVFRGGASSQLSRTNHTKGTDMRIPLSYCNNKPRDQMLDGLLGEINFATNCSYMNTERTYTRQSYYNVTIRRRQRAIK